MVTQVTCGTGLKTALKKPAEKILMRNPIKYLQNPSIFFTRRQQISVFPPFNTLKNVYFHSLKFKRDQAVFLQQPV